MDHATCAALLSATYFATSLLPLTVRLIPVIVEVGRLIVRFRRAEPTPQLCHRFETQLSDQLRELGRLIVEWTFNHIEPHDRADMPKQMCFEGIWYRRRSKTPNRKVATLFGTITVWRMLYQPLHGVNPSIFPLEIRLGLEAGLCTPALTERVAQAATATSQNAVLAMLERDHGVCWSVATLRKVIAGVATNMEPHRHDAAVDRVLAWLEQADQSRGNRKPVLAVGRDGLMLPIRGEACYREGATATISVHDRRGQRLGTVYLGRMPEPGQENVVATVDNVAQGGVAAMDRSTAAVGLYHRWGIPTDPVLPPGAQADEQSPLLWEEAEVGVGDRLLSCVRIHLQNGRCVILRPQASPSLGAEDVPLAEKQTKGDSASVALGGGDPGAEHRGPCKAQAVPHRLQLFAEANPLPGLLPIPSGPPADRQRGDGSGVQDGVHPAAETVRDDMETGGRSVDRRSAQSSN